MAIGTATSFQRSNTITSPARRRMIDHRFYTFMAFAMAFGVFAGFTPTYYARTYFILRKSRSGFTSMAQSSPPGSSFISSRTCSPCLAAQPEE